MEIQVNKQFLKDLLKIPIPTREKIEILVFEEAESYKSLEETGLFIKLKGYKNFYRARFGEYRIGVQYSNGKIIFERALHRKDIYKFFP
ncbi:type II toxin-antitoxin system RelE family toxin [Aquiflexum lacus]|uniref:type II toxin-antitoxin system RelE family toxin n=1 Tax=Aquiflexum lacus TaxID=2483805 RepID=UPI0018949E70|nr:type II toxin-antitoxin system RelE/ParE family toxin [Aquiflexum lacus]